VSDGHATQQQIRRYALAAFALWTLLVGVLLAWQVAQERRQVTERARTEAQANLSKDLAFRRWATSHGGAYVPPTATTPPNPYLVTPERDVLTDRGQRLTLMNPAYMLRQLMEFYSAEYGVRGHITSLRLLNPNNAPDAWEREALLAFERGVREAATVAELEGARVLRLMRPMLMEGGCLKCHAATGVKVGEVRGGISVAVPLAPYEAQAAASINTAAGALSGVWLAGALGIGFVARRATAEAGHRGQAAAALRASEAQTRLLLESSGEGILGVDAECRCSFCNPAALTMLGYGSAEEVLGKPLHNLIHHSRSDGTPCEEASCPLGSTVKHGIPAASEDEVFWRRDGTGFPVAVRFHPMRAGAGIQGAVITFSDITERKCAEAEIRQLNESLERRVAERTAEIAEAYRDLESYAYSTSHDLRAPLRALNGYAQLLLEAEGPRLAQESRRMLERIVHNSNKMGSLIDGILDYERASRQPLAAVHVELQALAREIAAESREGFPATQVTIGPLPPASGDPLMLRQVLANLIGNALKFSAAAAQPRVEIGALRAEGETRYYVRDNGAGFDMQYAGKLFGMFQRMHAEADFPGSGIGLAIAKRLVERHGGRIWAEAAPGAGATFYFTLG
jgi:PAS domain S-box-containing protein